MHFSPPKKIFVESECQSSRVVSNLQERLPEAEMIFVDKVPEDGAFDPTVLEVVRFRGRFLKSCPGTRGYHCCGYQILHFATQCHLNCTYCILQAYLNQPNHRIFGNLDEMFSELSKVLESHPHRLYRIGTGEFTDSLLLDPWTGFSEVLVPFFARRHNAVLELKTKTNFVENLRGLDHGGRTIVAWSLNSRTVQRREEPRAANIIERLEAARRCSDWGYFLAFHFDPIIEHRNWQEEYAETVEMLFRAIDARRVVWISLGALRFMPDLKPIIQNRHPHSRILYGEFIKGLDKKMRYFRDIRIDLYASILSRIKRHDPDLYVYLCMESGDIWKRVFGYTPQEKGGLAALLDLAVKDRMGIGPE